MHSESRLIHWTVWGFLAVVIFSIVGVFGWTLLRPSPPPLPVYGDVPDFRLTNQLGRAVSLADLQGQVWVADIIFTRCPGPCLQMTRAMKAIEERLPQSTSVRLVSLTADPEFDKPPVLNTYASRFKADSQRWQFLTGPKQAVYDLAMKGLKLAVEQNSASTNIDEMFIHSTRLVLVDRLGRLRGVGFDGSEAQSVPAIVRAVDQLARER